MTPGLQANVEKVIGKYAFYVIINEQNSKPAGYTVRRASGL